MRLEGLREQQLKLADKVVLEDSFSRVETVGGVDAAYEDGFAYGAAVVLDYETLDVLDEKTVKVKVTFPYIPTYLSFREYPVMERAFHLLKERPTVLMVDGNGILHPHKIGLASHAGVLLNHPTVGVAKSLLCGGVNDRHEVVYKGEVIGFELKATKAKPVYVSPGHMVSMETAVEIATKTSNTRIAEPVKKAHALAKRFKERV
jgi:deoxyribonuclease V